MTDTAAALVIQLSADFKQFKREMRAATGDFDAESRKIEKRQAQLKKKLETSFSGIGKYLVGGAALYGLERFISAVVDAGGKIQDVADVTKIGTDEIQAWGIMAERNGASQDDFNKSLEKFSKNLGTAAITGGATAQMYKNFGINLKAGPTEAFYQLADAVAATKNPQQQVAMTMQLMGRSGAALTPILAQGSAALKRQTADLVAQGAVIKTDAISKLDDLGDTWSDLKRQFLAIGGNALSQPISNLTEALKDPQLQSSLKTFAEQLGYVAVAVAKIAKYAPIIAGVWAGVKVGDKFGGLRGAIIGGAVGGVGGAAAMYAMQSGSNATSANPASPTSKTGLPLGFGTLDRSDAAGTDAKRMQAARNAIAKAAQKDITDTSNMQREADDQAAQGALDVWNAQADLIKEQDQARLRAAQGTQDYYKVQQDVIEGTARLDIQSILERQKIDIQSLQTRVAEAVQAAKDEADARKAANDAQALDGTISHADAKKANAAIDVQMAAQSVTRQKDLTNQITAIEQSGAAQIAAINVKKFADLDQASEDYYQTQADAIRLNDGIRQSLMDVGTAAVHGFKSMKDAAASALEQIAQMILQMYVLKPLVEGLLGPGGTSAGGIIGSIFGFANGGVMTPNGPRALKRYAAGGTSNTAAIFGEAGPEAAVPLPDGRRIPVELRLPSLSSMSRGGAQVSINIDARGAQAGVADQIDMKLRAAMPVILAAADKQNQAVFPSRLRTVQRDVF